MKIIIREYSNTDLNSLNQLLYEAFNMKKSENKSNYNIELVAIINETVVGYLTLNPLYDSVQNINYAHINYVCTLKEYRNIGIATRLFQKVFDICKKQNISYIELTSNKARIEAHDLYKKLGFDIRETNVFRKELI